MKTYELGKRGTRRWIYFGREAGRNKVLIDTNQYLIIDGEQGLLLDPGGLEIFPAVFPAVSREISVDHIEAIFSSHQDPDVISSLAMWLSVCPDLKVYGSRVWAGFIPHFGGGLAIEAIPDEGMTLPLGATHDLLLIPAHYLHASGNFSLYDPQLRILFSGDIGAALLPDGYEDLHVRDFDEHVALMEGFHRRWMPSNQAKNQWIARIRQLDVDMICPQHGAVFRKEHVGPFLDWLEQLEVGIAA